MKILIYTIDKGGIRTYTQYLASAMKEMGFDVLHSDKIDYHNFDIVHIHFDYSQFHPWGLGLIPMLLRLKLNGKKVVVTIGTILKKKDTYTRNKFFTFFKKIILSISNKLISIFSEKITVMVDEMKETLIKDYHINGKKVQVVLHGNY